MVFISRGLPARLFGPLTRLLLSGATVGLMVAVSVRAAAPTAEAATLPPSFTSSATVASATVAPGQAQSIVASVKSASAATAMVDVEVHDQTGLKVGQKSFDNQTFAAGEMKTYQYTWPVPTTARAGALYSVEVAEVAAGDWSKLYNYNSRAGQFLIGGATPSFTSTASVSSPTVAPGQAQSIVASVKSATGAMALVDVEVHNQTGQKVGQQSFDNQTFAAGETKTYPYRWNVPANALIDTLYSVQIAEVAAGDWSKLYNYNDRAAQFLIETSTCSERLQTQIDLASPGSVVKVPACVYRELVSITKPLTLDGQGAAEIRGSDVWSNWAQSGASWLAGPLPALPRDVDPSHCAPGTNNRCLYSEQVFLDGKPLIYDVGTPAPSGPGHFAVDQSRNVVLADNPNGRTLEVSTRSAWANIYSDNVTVRGFTMRHAANPAQIGAIGSFDRSNFILQDSVLSDTHGPVVSVSSATGAGSGARILRNDISRSGQVGVQGANAQNTLVQSNRIHDNNTDGFDEGWEAGGAKFAGHRGLILDANDVYNNNGPGLWCDIGCQNATFSNNRVHGNWIGIFFEISNGAKISGNAVWSNVGWAGIYISSSANAEVSNNTLAWNLGSGIFVSSENRDQSTNGGGAVGNYIHDNAIIMGQTNITAMKWWQNWGVLLDPASNNHGNNNWYWYRTPEDSQIRFEWQTPDDSLAQFNQTPGGQNGSYLTDADKTQRLAALGISANQ